MAHEIAKLILEHADSPEKRKEAIRTALSLKMSLVEIEEYLDWLDGIRPHAMSHATHPSHDAPQPNNSAEASLNGNAQSET